jgi:2-dehydropantoate 2-reductase
VLPRNPLVSGVVALHAQHVKAGHVVLLQSEGLLVGRLDAPNDELVERVRALLDKAVPTSASGNMRGARWTKLIVNLSHVLPQLCGAGFRRAYKDPKLRSLAIGMMGEGIAVAERAGIRLESIPGTSVPLLELEKHLLKDATRGAVDAGRPTEVEYLNGEIMRLARNLGVAAPLNEAAVELAARVAATRRHLSLQEVAAAFPTPS